MNLIKKLLVASGLGLLASFVPSNAEGESHIHKRIINGKPVVPTNKYPFMVRVMVSDEFNCGGTLIDPYWVLSAGHCFYGFNFDVSQFGFEAHRYNVTVSVEQENAKVYEPEYIIVHPEVDFAADKYFQFALNDVALIKLKNPITDITPILLDKDGTFSNPGDMLTVSGWGTTSPIRGDPTGLPEVLQEVDLPIVNGFRCGLAYPGVDMNNLVCAGYDLGVFSACYGDSGGPLFGMNSNGQYVQVGIVSSGRVCAGPFAYNLFARVSTAAKFIEDTIATYSNPCLNNPCHNDGRCSALDVGMGQFSCICKPGFTGPLCETSYCTGDCLISTGFGGKVKNGEVKSFEIDVSGFPTTFSSATQSFRIYTSVVDIYGVFVAVVTSPSGKQVTLQFFPTFQVNSFFNCFLQTAWDFDAKNNITNCPATLLRPVNFVDFNGDDLNGKWVITVINMLPPGSGLYQTVDFFSWGVAVDTVQTCTTTQCQNGGTCTKKFGSEMCDCPSGTLGNLCQITPCSPNPCAQGTCYVDGLSPRCVCDQGFTGRYCDKLSCPQGCLFGQCQQGGKCNCDLGWTGPSCSIPDVGNSGEALCFTNNEQVYDGASIPASLTAIETAVSVSKNRNCAIETVSGTKSIIDVGYVVNDGFSDYCCRGRSEIAVTSPDSGLKCITRDCSGGPSIAGSGSAAFALDPSIYGGSCYHSCVDATLSSTTCTSSPIFKGSLISLSNKRAPGDSLYISKTPSTRKDCLVSSGTTLSSGYTIQLDDGRMYCCSKGTFDAQQEICTSGCFMTPLAGRPFVMEGTATGGNCFANCYAVQ